MYSRVQTVSDLGILGMVFCQPSAKHVFLFACMKSRSLILVYDFTLVLCSCCVLSKDRSITPDTGAKY
jgi:hypothetical protein